MVLHRTTIYFERKLHLNYLSVAAYKNGYNLLSVLLLPYMARLLDRIDPRQFASLTFAAMALHLALLGLTSYCTSHFVWHGVMMVLQLSTFVHSLCPFCLHNEFGVEHRLVVFLWPRRGLALPVHTPHSGGVAGSICAPNWGLPAQLSIVCRHIWHRRRTAFGSSGVASVFDAPKKYRAPPQKLIAFYYLW
jgi:hypothetical protein